MHKAGFLLQETSAKEETLVLKKLNEAHRYVMRCELEDLESVILYTVQHAIMHPTCTVRCVGFDES